MPDFGLTEALAQALKATGRGVGETGAVMRPAEAKLAAQAAKAAQEAAAPAAPSVQAPSATPAPGAIQAPALNPSVPPPDIPPAAAATVPEASEGVAAQPVAAATADAMPPTGVPPGAAVTSAPGLDPPMAPRAPAPAPDAIPEASKLPPAPVAPELASESAATVDPIQAQARKFVQANLSDFESKLDLTHMPNVETMQSPDGVKAAILQLADDNKELIEAARGKAASHDQLLGMAQDLMINPDTLKQTFDREFGTVADTAAGDQRRAVITAARIVEQNNMGTLLALSDRVARGVATPDDIIQWHQSGQSTLAWMTRLMGAKAEGGRDLNVLGMKVGDSLPPEVRQHIADILSQNNPDMAATAKAISLAGTPQGIATILQGSVWARGKLAARSLLHRVFINGILSGTTSFKILWNNTINLGLNAADIGAGAAYRGLANLAARVGRYPTAEEGAALDDMVSNLHGTLSGVMDGLRVAGRVIHSGRSIDDLARVAEGSPKTAQTFQSLLPELDGTIFGSVARVIDTAVDFPGRIIAGIDDFTKTMGYRGYVTMMSMKEIRARLASGNLEPEDAAGVARGMMQDPTDEVQQAGEAWAHRMTFQTPWAPGGPGARFQNFMNSVPELRFIFPFMRTATNIFKQSIVERTPLGLLSARLRNTIAAGGMEADIAKARITTGTMLGGALAWMASNDMITGGSPKDAKERLLWEADGRQPYSVKIPGHGTGQATWRSYQWFEPMATIAGAVADTVGVGRYLFSDPDTMVPHEQHYSDAAAHIVAAIIENTGNKTFMQGAAAFSEMWNDPKRAFQMWFDENAAAMVPYSGATKTARNFQDPYLRQAYTLLDKIKDDLPTFMGISGSKTLPSRLDFFGEPRMREGGDSIAGPLTPMPGSRDKTDTVLKEIKDLSDQTQTTPLTMPSKQLAIGGAEHGVEGGAGMKLTPRDYNEYVSMSRADPIFADGTRTFRDELQRIINSPVYQQSSPATRVDMLRHVQSQADKIGAMKLYNENQDFRERMQTWNSLMIRQKTNQ